MDMQHKPTSFLVDLGGTKKAAIADLEAELEEINTELLARVTAGEGEEGTIFRASHIKQAANSTAWKSIATKLQASRQIIAANTKKGTKEYIKYTARKTA